MRRRIRKRDRENLIQREVNELFAEYRQKMKNGDYISWHEFDSRLKAICSSSGDYQAAKKYAVSAGYAYVDVLKEYAKKYGCAEYDRVLRYEN